MYELWAGERPVLEKAVTHYRCLVQASMFGVRAFFVVL